ncbi:MAG: type I methionyl aminopeptidase [Spirochaetales bacterium]|nr:type I methionyl aminopeptidase [Spirochaetales bacterium]MBP7263471.1 type I methionyl aminopeptidase [Spirochaetia bacterium]
MVKLKNREQLEGIRTSCRLLSEMFSVLVPRVKEGITTADLDAVAREFIVSHGGKPAFLGYYDYPASLCVSVNEEVIHGIPGSRVLKPGDIVGLDCGIDLHGYFSDAAITVPVPPVSPKAERLMATTRECLDLAIKAAHPGGRVHDISRAVFAHAKTAGFGVVRQYCGHGVGLAVHEDPQVPNYVGSGPNPRLVPGMVLAIEPMINAGGDGVEELDDGWTVVTRDRSLSAHYEHTIAITEDGVEVLTAW